METSSKIALGALGLAVLTIGGVMLYKHNTQDPPATQPALPPNVTPQPPVYVPAKEKPKPTPEVVSNGSGFKSGNGSWSKGNISPVYDYPNGDLVHYIGFIKKQATAQAKYISDANTKGWIKASATYLTPDGKNSKTADVYMHLSDITNVAP